MFKIILLNVVLVLVIILISVFGTEFFVSLSKEFPKSAFLFGQLCILSMYILGIFIGNLYKFVRELIEESNESNKHN